MEYMKDGRSSRREFVRSMADRDPLLSRAGRPYSVFMSTQASASERWAAEELRDHIERMAGIRLPVETGERPPASRRVIALGQSAITEQYGIEPPQGESCLLKTVGETIIIAGGRQRGTMYGVSIFLEKLGCRWFTSDIARIPRMESLRLPELNEVHRPAFEYREVFFTEAQGREWSARNRLNGHFHQLDERVGGKVTYMPFAHSYYDLVPPDRNFADHPEYFALVHGRRRSEKAQLCLTNTDVLRLAVQQAKQWLADHPDVSVVSVSQNDGGGWCECEPCRQVIKEEGDAASGLALRFVNQVAERLALSHPGKIVDMLAYQNTANPPSIARPLPNVQIRLCPIDACQAHSYRACAFNRPFRDRLEQWSRIAPKLHIWQYSVNFSHFLAPFPNYDALISDIPMFQRVGISGLFIEGAVSPGGGGDDAELRSWLAARLLWKPDLDPQKEIGEFLDAVYGPAAPLLRDYFALRQREVRRGQHLWIDQNVDAPYLTRDFLKHGKAVLQRAGLKATTNAARRRIDRHLLGIEYVETMRERRCVIQGASYAPAEPAGVIHDTQKLLKTAEELGITHFREGYPIAQQVKDWGDLGRRYEAIVLTNAAVIPELGGRIIHFGRTNVLRVADPGELGYPNAGGIYVALVDRSVKWQQTSATPTGVSLDGISDPGCALVMQIGVAGDTLRLRVTASNTSGARVTVAILCHAELAVDGALLSGVEFSEQERLVVSADGKLRIRNRFHAEGAGRCSFNWSQRRTGGLNTTVGSPQVELAPGEQVSLTSEYDLMV